MKILMINKSDHGGGAAIASTDLAWALKKYCDCEIIFASAKVSKDNSFPLRGKAGWIIEELIDRITRKLGFEYIFFPFSKHGILKAIKDFKPDIINVHNIHSGYFETSFLKKIRSFAPVVWSIHDMWAITGHCTVAKGCTNWMNGCGNCPDLGIYPSLGIDRTAQLFEKKRKLVSETDITAVSPSAWILDSICKSPIWNNKPVESISYGVDENLFVPMEKQICRERFGINKESFVVLLTAEKLSGKTKGEDIIEKILDSTAEKIKKDLVLLTGGKKCPSFSGNKFRHIHTGYLQRDEMPFLYNAADVNVSPTTGEAFGLTIVEAGLCNVPSIVFNAGGTATAMGEIQSDNLIPYGDTAAFSDKIIELSHSPEKILRNYYSEKFSLRKSAENFYLLYKKVLRSK